MAPFASPESRRRGLGACLSDVVSADNVSETIESTAASSRLMSHSDSETALLSVS